MGRPIAIERKKLSSVDQSVQLKMNVSGRVGWGGSIQGAGDNSSSLEKSRTSIDLQTKIEGVNESGTVQEFLNKLATSIPINEAQEKRKPSRITEKDSPSRLAKSKETPSFSRGANSPDGDRGEKRRKALRTISGRESH